MVFSLWLGVMDGTGGYYDQSLQAAQALCRVCRCCSGHSRASTGQYLEQIIAIKPRIAGRQHPLHQILLQCVSQMQRTDGLPCSRELPLSVF
ncbi:MAG TPA: hypothetical protein PLN94_11820 [Thiolinea sp.]|nr:hypothetical protein [Thiolinea sp.]